MKKQGDLTITKKLFFDIIKNLKLQKKYDDDCTKSFQKILSNDFVTGYDNSILYDDIIFLLTLSFNDEKDNWIEYFIYDLDFGRNTDETKIQINDKDFYLDSAEKLWLLLTNSI